MPGATASRRISTGRIALVTGASGGLGAHFAAAFGSAPAPASPWRPAGLEGCVAVRARDPGRGRRGRGRSALDVADAASVTAPIFGGRGRTFRPARHPRQQCRHRHDDLRPGPRRDRVGRRPRHEPQGRLPLRPGGGAADEGRWRRRDRQRRLDPGLTGRGRRRGLCGLEGGARPAHQGAGARMGAARHPRQRALPGLCRDGDQPRLLRQRGRRRPW